MIAHDDRRVIGWASAVLILTGASLGGAFGALMWNAPAIAAWWHAL